jgi:hypothetical protein
MDSFPGFFELPNPRGASYLMKSFLKIKGLKGFIQRTGSGLVQFRFV